MGENIGVLLADSSEDFMLMLSEYIEQEKDMLVLGRAKDGEKALKMAKDLEPSVLITDILLRQTDGVAVMRELKKCGALPSTIVVSAFYNDNILAEIRQLGASYCLPKPFSVEELMGRIRECGTRENRRRSFTRYDSEIANAINCFGVMPHLQGCAYLRESVRRCIADGSSLKGITKILYPDVAKAFNTTPGCVERSMRNAIEFAWDHGDAKARDAYYGEWAKKLSKRPTNSQFIAVAAELVLGNVKSPRGSFNPGNLGNE